MATPGDTSAESQENEEADIVEVSWDIRPQNRTQSIKRYGSRMSECLRNAVSHTVAAGRHANDSLVDLQSQNDNLARLKEALNDSHTVVTATQQIVASYVNSMRWIHKSFSWQRPAQLDNTQRDDVTQPATAEGDAPSYWMSLLGAGAREAAPSTPAARTPVNDAIEEFSADAAQQLDTLIGELRSNRQKTELISAVVLRQNDELEKISDSAVALQDRVAQVNRVLRENT